MSSKAQKFTDGFAITGKLEVTCKGSCGYGENYAMGAPTKDKNMTAGIVILIDTWYIQSMDYDYTAGQGKPGKTIDYFTALVWKSTTKVGIGASVMASNGNIYLLIIFSPPGNSKGGYVKNVLPPDDSLALAAAGKNEADSPFVVPTSTELIGLSKLHHPLLGYFVYN